MKAVYVMFAWVLLSSPVLAQSKKPARVVSKKGSAGKTTAKAKKTGFRPILSKTVVSSSVMSTSINSTPTVSTTLVSTTAISKTTTTQKLVSNAEGAGAQSTENRVSVTDSSKAEPHPAKLPQGSGRKLLAVDSAKLTVNQVASTTGAVVIRRRLIPRSIETGSGNGGTDSCQVLANDALLVYNLCANGPCGGKNSSALQLRVPKSDKRKWQYFKASDNVRMNIVSINPSSCTLTLNTIGLQNEFIVDQSPIQFFTLTPAATTSATSSTAQPEPTPNPLNQPRLSASQELIDSVTANQQTIASYVAALQEERRLLAAQPCISNEDIASKLNGVLAGETISRQQLQTNQHNLLTQLTGAEEALRKTAEEGLAALQSELDHWTVLLAGTMVRGPVMQARDNDFIRFVIKRRCGINQEETLPTIDIPVYGNFRLNVSTGFLVSGLVDHKYLAIDRGVIEAGFPTTSTVFGPGSTTVITESAIVNAPLSSTSSSTKVPVQDITSKANIGIGALLHAYITCPWAKGKLTPAVSLGASLNAAGRYTLLFGGSLIVSGSQRIVLTGGYALGPVARLQQPFTTEARQEKVTVGQLETNRTIKTAYEFSGAEFPTTPKNQGSWFFAVTFNMSSKRNPVLSTP
jgi:hypothetical protein